MSVVVSLRETNITRNVMATLTLPNQMTQGRPNDPSRRWIVLLVAALTAWGLYHAVGAFLFNKDVRRGLVVFACMALFLAFWLSLLKLRKSRQEHKDS